tara:strand:+ start:836 stop:1132 length:297 start_codon:yes stop_codon:yes gene_type:complete
MALGTSGSYRDTTRPVIHETKSDPDTIVLEKACLLQSSGQAHESRIDGVGAQWILEEDPATEVEPFGVRRRDALRLKAGSGVGFEHQVRSGSKEVCLI